MITIWAKNIREQKNHSVAFFYKGKLPNNSQIEIAAANAYRLFVNGELLGYGPARAYHKHTRKDVYNLTNMHNSKTTIVVEVFAANVNSYYLIDEPPFFGACIIDGEKTIANTLDFKAFILNDRVQKVQRYSYGKGIQRANSRPCNEWLIL